MLPLLSKHKNYIGLYRDEKSRRKSFKIYLKKNIQTFQRNAKIINYLDITLKLNDALYRPYRKPNEETNYIHVNSDHLLSIIKEIPRSIEKRLSILSSSKNIFQESAIYYEKCLKNSGYKTKLQYQQPKENNQNKKKRKRNIIWFNPPYSKSVKTNIGKILIQLIIKHFSTES